ncbi:6151_t:CDS:2, partial [Diversispora eburnea]
TISALLENNIAHTWYIPTLQIAAFWLCNNDNFFKVYNYFYNKGNINRPPLVFPNTRILLTSDNNIRSMSNNLQPTEIIVPNTKTLLFPELFPLGQSHYTDYKSSYNNRPNIDTLVNYICLCCNIQIPDLDYI